MPKPPFLSLWRRSKWLSPVLQGRPGVRCPTARHQWRRSEGASSRASQVQFVSLPPGITAGISPENSIGEIYRYTVESPDHDLLNEKTVNDWIVSRQLSTVPGVIGDSTFGGLTKQYHVDVDPQKLDYYHIPLSTLTGALGRALGHDRSLSDIHIRRRRFSGQISRSWPCFPAETGGFIDSIRTPSSVADRPNKDISP